MNKVILMGRLTRDPEVHYAASGSSITKFTLAVDRRFKSENGKADFPSVVCFGKTAEFVERYISKGTKICLTGRIQTGSYTKEDGTKVYTTDVIAEEVEFAESRKASGANKSADQPSAPDDGEWMNISDDAGDDTPFI